VEVEKLTERKMISKDSRKTNAKIVKGLKKKSGERTYVIEKFLCCLLMADDSLETKEGEVFSGVFKVKLRSII
jgi:hypothetical protein